MAKIVITDAEVIVNSVNLSDHVSSVVLNYSAELQDDSAMGVGSTRSRIAGLLNWTIEVTFQQDFDSASVDATLFPLVGAASFTVTVMANATAGVSATNPRFSGSAVIETYPIFTGTIGEIQSGTVVFQSAGALSRLTA